MTGIYILAILVVAIIAIFRGYRSGFVGQIAEVLGMGFGLTCARMFAPEVEVWLRGLFPSWGERVTGEFAYSLTAAVLIFAVVYAIFCVVGIVLKAALSILKVGTLNSLAGTLFSLLEYLTFASILLNVMLAFSPRSSLMHTATADDGNIVRETMFLAPALLGCENFEELAHKLQLEDARKISENCSPKLRKGIGVIDIYSSEC